MHAFLPPTLAVALRALCMLALLPALLPADSRPLQAAPPAQVVEDVPLAEPSFSPILLDPAGRTAVDIAVGDLNGDGSLDLVVGNEHKPSRVYLNDGHGRFKPSPEPLNRPSGNDAISVAVGDLDGDGSLDIVLGTRVYLNDAHGGFKPLAAPIDSDGVYAFSSAVGDLNGDGSLDLVLRKRDQSSQVYLNRGDATFQPAALLNPGTPDTTQTNSVAVGDLNGDGSLDIVLGNSSSTDDPVASHVYLNDGKGGFKPAPEPLNPGGGNTQSVALGDLNGDGSLDLVLGNAGVFEKIESSQVYLNRGDGTFRPAPSPLNPGGGNTQSVALGDLNGDGSLDLVLGNEGDPSQVYLNRGDGIFRPTITPLNPTGGAAQSIALGDLDGDGGLDIVLANRDQPSQIYLNQSGGSFGLNAAALNPAGNNTYSVAAGDLDGDGSLDLVLGNLGDPSQVYLNDGRGSFKLAAAPLNPTGSNTRGVAVGDLNGDGSLDLVLGNDGQPSQAYLNDGHAGFTPAAPLNPAGNNTRGVAVGDLNGDGSLDLVLGNDGQPSQAYLNDGHAGFTPAAAPLNSGGDETLSVALGDLNGDDALDIVLGNVPAIVEGEVSYDTKAPPLRIYLNRGDATFRPVASPLIADDGELWSPDTGDLNASVALGDLNGDGRLDIVLTSEWLTGVYLNQGDSTFRPAFAPLGGGHTAAAVGDLNGDGSLDLVLGHRDEPGAVYINQGDATFRPAGALQDPKVVRNSEAFFWRTLSAALGDLNGDGRLDIVLGNGAWFDEPGASQVILNRGGNSAPLPNNPPTVSITRPGPTTNAPFYSAPAILDSRLITLTYTLADPDGDPVRAVAASYSLDGGGTWHTAVPTNTVTTDLAAPAGGAAHTFTWDTLASGVFGQSDDVVFRILAYPGVRPVKHGRAGPNQRPYAAAVTFPFRVRGTQVLVRPAPPDAARQPVTVPGAPVFKALADAPALVYRIPAGQPGRPLADPTGQPYLTDGRGYLHGRGEIAIGDRLVALQPIAATSAYTAYLSSAVPTETGLDAFTVTSPGVQTLAIAPANPLVLLKLAVSLEWDASADAKFQKDLAFDLRRASELLYDWSDGQIALGEVRVYQARGHWDDADVRLFATNRMRPNSPLGGLGTRDGQVRIGSVWNRFGDPGGNQGEDWPRALAHELGHFALFLDDNYLGLDGAGRLVAVESCPGAMNDPYRDDQSELRTRANWLPGCESTLSQRNAGRADWSTVTGVYPWLRAPNQFDANPGPSTLPLEVTQVRFVEQGERPAPLAVPLFNLTLHGARVEPGDQARAVLYPQRDGQVAGLIDLGRPVLDQVLARGARAGDRLCVYDLGAVDERGNPTPRLGCTTITPGSAQLALSQRRDWRPEVNIGVGPDRALTLDVPAAGVGKPEPPQLEARLFSIDTAQAPRQITLALEEGWYRGAFPADLPLPFEGYVQIWVDGDDTREIVTDYTLGGNPTKQRQPPRRTRRRAPAISNDGQAMLYGSVKEFKPGQFYAIQTATGLPQAPAWATPVGQGYRVLASSDLPLTETLTLNLGYAPGDVARGTENGVSMYRWDGAAWMQLPTERGGEAGEVTAPIQGPGLYVLMSSAEIPLRKGRNLFAYPIPGFRPVDEALASIEGAYSSVRGFDAATQEWLVYTAGAPDSANSLKVLEYGKGYEVEMKSDALLLLRGARP